jgi:hypothetical protein
MKLIRKLKSIWRKNNNFRGNSRIADPEGNKEYTLKRSRLSGRARPFSKTQSRSEAPCHTKRFKRSESMKCCRWVFTVVGGNDQGRQFIGATTELKIGRQPENHICLRDPKVSRFHAIIKIKDSYLTIKDLHSTNGTLVNNMRIRRHKLQSGDLIKLGDSMIRVTLEKD